MPLRRRRAWTSLNVCRCSAPPIKQFIKDEDMDIQLTPPQMHRRNWSERAIQTGKAHLIAGLVGINPNFPLHLWCRLIPQYKKTLNMMRPTHINPKISADTYVQGTHDFNRVPLAPPGILTVIHKSPDTRKSYAPHGLKSGMSGEPWNTTAALTSGAPTCAG